jgi:BirA family biotin operon repressor/biotin-[acetyl-CoA-carboxylase] ligase
MLTEHTVAEAVAAAGITAPPRFVEITDSTNSDLLAMAAAGAPEWTVLVAGQQEGGRGRLGRTWVSKPGASLLVSVLLRPEVPPDEAVLLTLAAGVAMAEAVRRVTGVQATCKWPNDVMVGDRKLAGILTEASVVEGRIEHAVVGVGVNVWQQRGDFPEDLQSTATSVVLEGGKPDMSGLLQDFLSELFTRYGGSGSGLPNRVLPAYRELCSTIGRQVRAAVSSGDVVEGHATGVGPNGELQLETSTGGQSVSFGEVVHLS